MYDYLAKIILVGPSGTGKYVFDMRIFFLLFSYMLTLLQVMSPPSVCQGRMYIPTSYNHMRLTCHSPCS